MVYIVMDLEWNSVYGTKIHGFFNEIIEIGAVMLDADFREISHFSCLIRSQTGGRLQAHVREMTKLSKKDLAQGLPFAQAITRLREWIGAKEHVVLTWGDGDLRVLLANTRYFLGSRNLAYLQKYMDLQQYFQHRFNTSRAQQVGLAAAGARLGVNAETVAFHRALEDSRFAAQCLPHIFDETDFAAFVRVCDQAFFAELEFKPRIISDINNPLVDREKLYYVCSNCGKPTEQLTDWRFASRGFQAEFYCPHCDARAKALISFKKLYNSVEIKRSARLLPPPEAAETHGAAEEATAQQGSGA
ncbi:MAG: exonuclease domain-containing protein [Oscillospiraceae bacterium]|jgi:inhibitor of KinA sporulation pathway (predicted exonuclease)/DNA-directed RNA polymerase subunit RPC12/RpoP|nr:exonuclease domain-containing protein [Oscillospiraceae bacterium]